MYNPSPFTPHAPRHRRRHHTPTLRIPPCHSGSLFGQLRTALMWADAKAVKDEMEAQVCCRNGGCPILARIPLGPPLHSETYTCTASVGTHAHVHVRINAHTRQHYGT